MASFPANGWPNPDAFKPKAICIPKGIIPQNLRSQGSVVLEELRNKQTNKQTDRQTHWQTSAFIEWFTILHRIHNISATLEGDIEENEGITDLDSDKENKNQVKSNII